MHQAQIRTESVLFVFPALSFVKSLYRFPSYRPPGRSFLYFGFRSPLNLSEIHARGRGGLQPGASRDSVPPWGGRPKAGRAAGSFARRSAKADHAARTSSRRGRTRPPGWATASPLDGLYETLRDDGNGISERNRATERRIQQLLRRRR